MREYEITYLISDDSSESEITKITGRISGLIADHKGEVLKEETWGRRKLVYPIKKQLFATYITVNFKMDGSQVQAFEKELFLMKEIIRHLLILREFEKEKLELTSADIAKNKDIEEVIGGEKSFEAIKGQTEESYNLMSKREDKEDNKEDNIEVSARIDNTELDTDDKKEIAKTEDQTKDKAEKPAKKTVKKGKEEAKDEKTEEQAEPDKPKAKKVSTKKKAEKAENVEDEADRLTKLNREIEDILGDDL